MDEVQIQEEICKQKIKHVLDAKNAILVEQAKLIKIKKQLVDERIQLQDKTKSKTTHLIKSVDINMTIISFIICCLITFFFKQTQNYQITTSLINEIDPFIKYNGLIEFLIVLIPLLYYVKYRSLTDVRFLIYLYFTWFITILLYNVIYFLIINDLNISILELSIYDGVVFIIIATIFIILRAYLILKCFPINRITMIEQDYKFKKYEWQLKYNNYKRQEEEVLEKLNNEFILLQNEIYKNKKYLINIQN